MRVSLRVARGPLAGREFVFYEADVFLIGRSEEAHCRLSEDPYVSRHHLLVEIAPPRVYVRDLGSRNGFLLNGQRIGGQRPAAAVAAAAPAEIDLRSGDILQVGETIIEVEIDAALTPSDYTVPVPSAAADSPKTAAAPRGEKPRDTRLLDAPAIPGYEIISLCGSGAMGRVYVGRSLENGGLAAIKVVRPRPGKSAVDIRRLEREVQILQNLRHPHIAALLGYGEIETGMYLLLEYLPEGGVDRLLALRGGRLPLAEAVGIMADALAGVAYAHSQGVVHRDLKPANILLGNDGMRRVAKISDLGLAKYCQTAGMSGLTVFGDLAGSYGYMPREQIISYRYVGPAADVFALGATFYVMITGEMIYDFAKNLSPLMMVLEGEIVPISKRGAPVPPALTAVIERALRIDAAERFPSAAEMREAFLAAAAADGLIIS